jgi:choline dehydrogenase-like flavoprotein
MGFEFSRQSGLERIDAAREVLLSAGAIGSPHLLDLLGVSGPEVLQKAGIAVHHALPGVGQNFARTSCYARDLETLNERVHGLGFANEIIRRLHTVTAERPPLTDPIPLPAAQIRSAA